MVTTMAVTAVLALYLFIFYRLVSKKTFYNKNFNISLAGVALITAAIILTIQSSIVISLGMVGALSIVRFRTAIKDPMDLMFLFWSISIGIICGAGLAEFAVILSLWMTVAILILEKLPIAKAPMILVVNSSDTNGENEILETVKKYAKHYSVKARTLTKDALDITVELRTAKGPELIAEINRIPAVTNASLLSHDGEVTF